jgi:hypothetical protein
MIRQLLSINTVPLKLSIDVPLGSYDMTSPKASWEIDVTKSEMTAKKDPIKIKIDRREMYASMGIYMPDNFRRKTEQESKQTVMDTIAEIGEDWRSIGETQGRTLVDICLKNSGWNPKEFYQTWIPGVKPDITWDGGTPTKVYFSKFKLDINWETHMRPEIKYNMGKKDISVSRWQRVNIKYNGEISDIMKFGLESMKKLNIKI